MDEFTPGKARPATADDMYQAMVHANQIVGEQRQQIAELKAALRDLVQACVDEFGTGDGEPDESSVYVSPDGEGLTFGHIRRSLAALDKR